MERRERERVPARVSELSAPSCCPDASQGPHSTCLCWGLGWGEHSLLLFVSTRLDTNQFQDPVMELLGSVLSGNDCRIQKIR